MQSRWGQQPNLKSPTYVVRWCHLRACLMFPGLSHFFTMTPCIILCKIKNKDWDWHGRKPCLKCEVCYPRLFSRPLLPHLLLKRRVRRWVVLLRNNPGTLNSDVHICTLGLFVFQFMLNWFFSNQVTSHDIVFCNWNFFLRCGEIHTAHWW